MKAVRCLTGSSLSLTAALLVGSVWAQPSEEAFREGAFGPPGGRGFGPGMQREMKLRAKFDRDGNKMLDAAERKEARAYLAENPVGRGPGGPGGRGGRGGRFGPRTETPTPGERIAPADVKAYGDEPFFDAKTLRTLFFTFDEADWERQLEEFHNTDVELPATLVVDGRTYRDVGVHFRGMSSYTMVGTGSKRSLGVSVDMVHGDQAILGHRTLNLLNAHEDPSFLRAALFSRIAQEYIAAPRVNFVRVVINGENWGIYASAEQFNKDFNKDRFGTAKSARWKVSGSPNGRGTLAYLGDDASAYKGIYEIKSKDDPASWTRLIRMCRALDESPPERLEAELSPLLDIDGALKFLALENVLVNADGYWTRTSDYSIAEDATGRLHIVPHDMNETFSLGGGPGGRGPGMFPPMAQGAAPDGERRFARGGFVRGGPGGGRGGGVNLDPLVVAEAEGAPLASKLLAVPALRTRYLGYVREIATTWLDWERLGPIAREYHALIDADVKRDTRKLDSYEEFVASLETGERSLKAFAERRRAYLLAHAAVQALESTSKAP